jgi:Ca-activated chloride channel family protein
MRRLLLLLAAALQALPLSAQGIDVLITSPTRTEPVFGEVAVVAEVYSQLEISRVELLLDGAKVAEVTAPPYHFVVDAGEENRQHRFEVRAHGPSGELGTADLVTPPLRIDEAFEVQLQQLYVTVLRGDERILGLTRRDFEIIDNGSRQEIVTFARGEIPLAAAVLIDASASMRGRRLQFAVGGATAFAEAMRPEDEISVQLFADRLLFDSPFTADASQLTSGLAAIEAGDGTALIDHLYLALKRLEGRQGRRVVVLLSDGIDSHSALGMPALTWLARRSRAMIYWIRLDPSDANTSHFSAWKNPRDYREEYATLEATVIGSGGRVITLEQIENVEEATQEILAELRQQYALGYYPLGARNDGSWHRVKVRLRPSDLTVRARGGYIDY